ncbi:hypothetical protein [Polynucleobacter necessarius]|uniref:hypothetical protein n=1 Tax=Polynucleobacter necessarius TaxID=576610 RepID=UPI001E6280A7|nr:hypothetical protein [Polynucleobacter necessarius]
MIDAPFHKGHKKDMEAIVAYVVTLYKGEKIKVSTAHPKEKAMYDIGKRAFFFQGGPMDFSCASCHGENGTRILLQDLPNITTQKRCRYGLGLLACISSVTWAVLDDATTFKRLVSSAAFPVPNLWLRCDDCFVYVYSKDC